MYAWVQLSHRLIPGPYCFSVCQTSSNSYLTAQHAIQSAVGSLCTLSRIRPRNKSLRGLQTSPDYSVTTSKNSNSWTRLQLLHKASLCPQLIGRVSNPWNPLSASSETIVNNASEMDSLPITQANMDLVIVDWESPCPNRAIISLTWIEQSQLNQLPCVTVCHGHHKGPGPPQKYTNT